MTDWASRLQNASFNGLGFYVETDDPEAGQRVSTAGIPNGRHVNEGFGPQARKFEVEAYFTGLDCYAGASALLDMAENKHRGILVLPAWGSAFVRLIKARGHFDKKKLGLATVSLEAVAEPDNAGISLSANALENQVYALASLAAAAFGLFCSASFRLAGQPSTVVEQAVTAAAGSLGDLVALRQEARLSPERLAQTGPAFDQALAALAGFATAPDEFGMALAGAAIALGDAADPANLAQSIVGFGRPADPPSPQVSQGTALVIAENAAQAVALTAASRALTLGEAMARRTYVDRSEAVEAPTVSTAVFDDALARVGRGGLDLARELAAMKGVLAELVTRREADLAPLITVSVPARMPSLWWAHRLYADPHRATELAKRAGAFNPASMPERFETLAS
ncbi:DNA circularization N-terminal domain-containing protein [Bosea sp. BK604]|uniref:DNA circularization N-terminal domain-containing protein n=1 Tax=Bosea sp. BK604 TaxID=2512180 RepID=UPI0010524639|nr:DNA circularization N-terminal domain-containing protein [Bosea sp. BK604]TCR69689.1 prophage DNA circulation protein [Bosea sp. BK604]